MTAAIEHPNELSLGKPITPQEIERILALENVEYSKKYISSSSGSAEGAPYYASQTGNGNKFSLYLTDLDPETKSGYWGLKFASIWQKSDKDSVFINKANQSLRFGKVYTVTPDEGDSGRLILDHDLTLVGGFSADHISYHWKLFIVTVDKFADMYRARSNDDPNDNPNTRDIS